MVCRQHYACSSQTEGIDVPTVDGFAVKQILQVLYYTFNVLDRKRMYCLLWNGDNFNANRYIFVIQIYKDLGHFFAN